MQRYWFYRISRGNLRARLTRSKVRVSDSDREKWSTSPWRGREGWGGGHGGVRLSDSHTYTPQSVSGWGWVVIRKFKFGVCVCGGEPLPTPHTHPTPTRPSLPPSPRNDRLKRPSLFGQFVCTRTHTHTRTHAHTQSHTHTHTPSPHAPTFACKTRRTRGKISTQINTKSLKPNESKIWVREKATVGSFCIASSCLVVCCCQISVSSAVV
jgi:hypothetical protein